MMNRNDNCKHLAQSDLYGLRCPSVDTEVGTPFFFNKGKGDD